MDSRQSNDFRSRSATEYKQSRKTGLGRGVNTQGGKVLQEAVGVWCTLKRANRIDQKVLWTDKPQKVSWTEQDTMKDCAEKQE